ncbi:hypothetical protein ACQR1Y_10685 [Bradyrhizobium sp. HKCCYLRH3099]|uniref:hypothetical protein n=1 Tax=unclassified Bradyrhizobium TaxID=2631580 RepID=UPI003EBF6EF8
MQPLSAPQEIPAATVARRPVAAITAIVAALGLAAAAAILWLQYGTAVFFDMIAAGWQACF